jgi:hypothetical protein
VSALEELMSEAVDVAADEFPLRERRGTCSVGADWFGRVFHRELCHSDIDDGADFGRSGEFWNFVAWPHIRRNSNLDQPLFINLRFLRVTTVDTWISIIPITDQTRW